MASAVSYQISDSCIRQLHWIGTGHELGSSSCEAYKQSPSDSHFVGVVLVEVVAPEKASNAPTGSFASVPSFDSGP